jgi:hypothetical protein
MLKISRGYPKTGVSAWRSGFQPLNITTACKEKSQRAKGLDGPNNTTDVYKGQDRFP